ncbi:unnamed protein product [Musa hybrid cultivar]
MMLLLRLRLPGIIIATTQNCGCSPDLCCSSWGYCGTGNLLLRRRVPLRAVRGFSSPRRRPRRPYRDAELLRRDHQPGRQRMRWQEFLQARRLLDRGQLLHEFRPRWDDRRLQAGDCRLLRAHHARNRAFLLHRRDRRRIEGLLRRGQHRVPMCLGEELLRPRPHSAVMEL